MARLALVAGAGGALGGATCRALHARGFRVVAASRSRIRLEQELGGEADELLEVELTSEESVQRALGRLEDVELLVYNAGRIDLLPLLETTPEVFESSWRLNAFGAFLCARTLAPRMLERKKGTMIFVGATSSVRGGARTHAFASSKHALRGLAHSLAKELGPRGVHVAHLVIDGKIWGDATRRRFPDVREDQCIAPSALADMIVALEEQPRSAWTFEMDVRPDVERWA